MEFSERDPIAKELLSGGKKGKVTLVVIGLVIIITLGVLIFFVFSGSHSEPKTSPLVSPVRSLSVLDVVDGRYIGERFNGSWISDYEILFRDESGSIILFNAATKSKKVLLPDLTSIGQTAFSYELSADKRFLLVGHSYHRLYRHSYLAHYVIVNLKTKQMLPISDPQGNPRQLQLVVWAPVGNALAYVFMNDIYYWPSVELNAEEVRITRNGRTNTIHNGVPDWVYEEEVFSSNSAMWFSNDASKLAFVTFNDTTTQVMSIPYYGQPGNFAFQYTQMVNIRYPKPGRPNPEVTLNVVDLGLANLQSGAPHLINIPPPTDLMRTEPIISTVAWATNSDITVNWMNRVQNKAHTALCSTINETCKIVMTIEEPVGWIELFTAPIFSSDGTKMALIYSAEEGNDRFRHVILVDLQSGDLKRIPLTHGKFSVTDLLSWDEENHEIYFLSTAEGVTSHLRISKVSDSIENAPHHAICVSCDILTLERKKCTYSGASFSKKSSYYAQTCAGPDVPEIRLFEKGGKELMVWENNEGLKNALSEVTLPVPKEFKVPIAGGFEAVVKLLLPPNMDTSGKTKYPLLIQVYGGPDSNLVTDRFGIDWHTYLTVNRSVIVGFIDGRNSGLRGDNLRFAGYRNLGTVEVEDTIYVTKYLQDNFNYIDKNRTAVWGWSYGGYTTIMALGNDTSGIFKCGIAVAPVVDWIYYDSIYTERFMGLPTVEDNLKGYINAAVFNRIENFKHKNFFLVHGTLDDNVHYQQSMMFAKVLEQNDILFRQQSYPDEEHGLNGVKPHLYHSLEQFLMDECYMIH